MLLYWYIISLQDVLLIVTVTVFEECTVIYIFCNSRGIEVPTIFPEVTQNIIRTHVGILVNNQIDALFNVFIYLFHFSTCFEQPSAHHQGIHLYQYIIWYVSLCVGDCLVCRSGRTGIPDSRLRRVIHTRWCIDTIDSPDDEGWVARNM